MRLALLFVSRADLDAARFDDPEFAVDLALFGQREELTEAADQQFNCCRGAEFQYDDSCALLGREPERLAKIAIQRDQGSLLGLADTENFFVGPAGETLIEDRCDVMTGAA